MSDIQNRLREQADLIEGESPGGETDASVVMREAADALDQLQQSDDLRGMALHKIFVAAKHGLAQGASQ